VSLAVFAYESYLDATTSELPTPFSAAPSVLEIPSAPPTCGYEGDPGEYAFGSFVARKLSPDSRKAFVTLANATALCSERVFSNAHRAGAVVALRALLADPLAAEAFEELARAGTPAGRLYGVIGLYYADRPAFLQAVQPLLRMDDVTVLKLDGCVGQELPVSKIVREDILGGDWRQALLGKVLEEGRGAAEQEAAPDEGRKEGTL
jgi:hypothetical protein